MNGAVHAARAAFAWNAAWRTMEAQQRGRIMMKWADLIERDADQLAVHSPPPYALIICLIEGIREAQGHRTRSISYEILEIA